MSAARVALGMVELHLPDVDSLKGKRHVLPNSQVMLHQPLIGGVLQGQATDLGIERLSKPGRRQYVAADEVPKVLGGMGTAIVSTSKGVMTGHDARRQGVGGEVLAQIY